MPQFADLNGEERAEFFNQHTILGSRGIELLNALDAAATDEFLSEESRGEKVQNIEAALNEAAAAVISPASARAAIEARNTGNPGE